MVNTGQRNRSLSRIYFTHLGCQLVVLITAADCEIALPLRLVVVPSKSFSDPSLLLPLELDHTVIQSPHDCSLLFILPLVVHLKRIHLINGGSALSGGHLVEFVVCCDFVGAAKDVW